MFTYIYYTAGVGESAQTDDFHLISCKINEYLHEMVIC